MKISGAYKHWQKHRQENSVRRSRLSSCFSSLAGVMLVLVLFMSSCTSSKKILYFQDLKVDQPVTNQNSFEARIKKDDILSIVVSGPDKTVVGPFNLTIGETVAATAGSPANLTLPYLVDGNGQINFPMLGKIKVEGMTRTQLVDLLTRKVKQYVTDPVVVVQFQNYKVSVLGEVRNPGTFNLTSERTTILQAIGMAGDLTIQAKRDDILLIRENDGKQVYYKIDLRKSDILTSPAYYVQQNDVIYVEPSSSRIATGTNIGSVWSIVLSSITTILTIVAITK